MEMKGKTGKNTIDCFLISYLVQEKSTFQQCKWQQKVAQCPQNL